MMYILIHDFNNDFFTTEYEDLKEAIKAGERVFDHLSDYDKKKTSALYVLESINPDTESVNHLDGDVVKSWI